MNESIADFENPYLKEADTYVSEDPFHIPATPGSLRRREELIAKYGFAVPTRRAIQTIVDHDPIIEVGAGCGYWARCIADAGGEIIATDERPIDERWEKRWFPVWKGSGQDMAVDYPHRTLLLVWPTYADTWPTEVLGRYHSAGGETVIYVGEGPGGCNADDRFHQMLAEDWLEVETVTIPSWPAIHDDLTVYTREEP